MPGELNKPVNIFLVDFAERNLTYPFHLCCVIRNTRTHPPTPTFTRLDSFTAFCVSILTGWLPQSTTTSPCLDSLRSSGTEESDANDFLIHVPSAEDDAALPQRDSPQKKLAHILSPNKKKKKRKNRKPPPPHPQSVEFALRTSHNRIAEIR